MRRKGWRWRRRRRKGGPYLHIYLFVEQSLGCCSDTHKEKNDNTSEVEKMQQSFFRIFPLKSF